MPRPQLTTGEVTTLVHTLYGLTVTGVRELISYDDRNYHVTVDSSKWENPHISETHSDGYVFKVLNAADSKFDHASAEHDLQRELLKAGFTCPYAVPTRQGRELSVEYFKMDNENHTCRLMVYVQGRTLRDLQFTDSFLGDLGRYVGKIHHALKGYNHEGFHSQHLTWDLRNIASVKCYLAGVSTEAHRQLASNVISLFEREVLAKPEGLTKGAIHADVSDVNILVKPKSPSSSGGGAQDYDIIGLIDFGDCAYSYVALELAVAMMHMMVPRKASGDQLFDVARLLFTGYTSVMELSKRDIEAIRPSAMARFAQYVIVAEDTKRNEPENEYGHRNIDVCWQQLEYLWNTPSEEFYRQLGIPL